ncbi:hypothetical protein [Streptomyces sp. A13(2022)]|uniref:hypothetical protein n=1 Tax=Streptomyces sp. A13(2022) TaxID=2964768 RepID=UPI0021D8AA81|nr:hypothetical protein [Streptomyces sp. A13(2022)]MCU8592146.1 hypothetical protein [Streptomyces sp. A13(2022)]
MQLPALRRMLLQASALATSKTASFDVARRRRHALESELAAAQAEEDVRAGSARSAEELVAALREQIERQQADAAPAGSSGAGGPVSARAAVGQAVREVLRTQEEAATKEIVEHVRQEMPDVNVKNVSPELTRLVQQGLLVRPRVGVYRLGGDWTIPGRG